MSAEDLKLATDIARLRAYLRMRKPANRTQSLVSWQRERMARIAELSTLEKQAIASHGTVACLLEPARLPASPPPRL